VRARDLIGYAPADERLLAQSIYWELRDLLDPNAFHRNVLIQNIKSKVEYRSEIYSNKPAIKAARVALWRSLEALDKAPDVPENWETAADLAFAWYQAAEEVHPSHFSMRN
jgi:hypothetical protein